MCVSVCAWSLLCHSILTLMDVFNYSIMNTMNSIKGLGSPWGQTESRRELMIRGFLLIFYSFMATEKSTGKFVPYGNALHIYNYILMPHNEILVI